MKKLTTYSLATLAAFTFLGCEKFEDLDQFSPHLNSSDLVGVCLNKTKADGPQQASPYQKLVWADEFNGPEAGEDPTCYSKTPTCITRQDWGSGEISCPAPSANEATELDGLRNLNKCNWSIWSGYSFWWEKKGTSFQRFHPSQVSVDANKGLLLLGLKVDRGLQNLKCGWNKKYQWYEPGFQDLDCPIQGGGVDASPRYDQFATGRNIKYGRVEVKASIQDAVGTFPAIWTGPSRAGPESAKPYLLEANSFQYWGEHDLLEAALRIPGALKAFQTYHAWGKDHHTMQGGDINLKPGTFYRYGLDRREEGVYFYVDDCYTKFIPKDAKDYQGLPLYQNDAPLFVMMNTYAIRDMITISNFKQQADGTWTRTGPGAVSGNFHQIDGSKLAIDYVRYFETDVSGPIVSGGSTSKGLVGSTWVDEVSAKWLTVRGLSLQKKPSGDEVRRFQMK